jgi:hypothetical protein
MSKALDFFISLCYNVVRIKKDHEMKNYITSLKYNNQRQAQAMMVFVLIVFILGFTLVDHSQVPQTALQMCAGCSH